MAAELLGVTPSAIYRAFKRWEDLNEFKDVFDKLHTEAARNKLREAIDRGEAWAVKFQLATKGGYTEKRQVEHKHEHKLKGYELVSPQSWDRLEEGDVIEGDFIE